jgi:acetyltransferase-like isoleucine patch superfamily enzyme
MYIYCRNFLRNCRNVLNTQILLLKNKSFFGLVKIGNRLFIPNYTGIKVSSNVTIFDDVKLITSINDGAKVIPQIILGRGSKVGDRVTIDVSSGQTFSLGDYSSIHADSYLSGNVSIGRFCLLSNNIFASSGNHYFNYLPHLYIKDQDFLINLNGKNNNSIIIQDDCWIGWGVVIKNNLVIGKGSVIGANSVVTKDIPPYSVACGSPAKIIKKRIDFKPLDHISLAKEMTFPYFYLGFKVSKREIKMLNSKLFCFLSEENIAIFRRKKYSKVTLIFYSYIKANVFLQLDLKQININLKPGLNKIETNLEQYFDVKSRISIPFMDKYSVMKIGIDYNSINKVLFSEAYLS